MARKNTITNVKNNICEGLAFPHLFSKGKFGCNIPSYIPISAVRYFDQSLASFNQTFASDPDYMFLPGLSMSVFINKLCDA